VQEKTLSIGPGGSLICAQAAKEIDKITELKNNTKEEGK